MKKIYNSTILMLCILATCFYGCEEEYEFGDVEAPSNLTLEATVLNTSEEFPYGDGSGEVMFNAQADNAITYEYFYGDNTSEIVSDGKVTYGFKSTGVHDYIVTVIAKGPGGSSTSKTTTVTVFSAFEDLETQNYLTGGASKTWYVAAALPGHLGVGPANTATPDYYSAAPFEKESEGCFYDDVMIFSEQNGNITYVQDNQGATFFNVDFLSVGGGGGDQDQCLGFDTSGEKAVNLSAASSSVPADQTTGTQIIIADGGFMAYYIEPNAYEILEISDDYMYVRAIPGSNSELAWYLKFTTDPAGGGGNSGNDFETEFPGDSPEEAAWSQEFDGSSLDTDFWNYEIGNNNGWGNGEVQYYTDQNTEVSDGTLKINVIAEEIEGFNYSSARITTQDKFEFQYGRIEVRAKLPSAGGTWPAIWMLGENFDTVDWPTCGEIDIMEHVGNNLGEVLGTLHFPENSGGNGVSQGTFVENVATEFHKYSMEWTEDHIVFLVDDEPFHEFTDMEGTPFVDHEFFLILNVAMGGTLGGDIDPNFTQDAMEIDYIRVYQ
ncbi:MULTISPECIES: glycoside hydrolase family 16 protein [Mesonia]|nr:MULTISPECIES: glycoside hydrolase family 16 protein [Mesonia]MAN26192.1 glycosyl hydrolase [Mesonia sp.]MAQ42624.1 glycosyl hydrolase [Mesonia sp.]|tara:strand:- start:9771 stop:11417 length:1647 start_codon:yes stop_codon:yes gene_type:complete